MKVHLAGYNVDTAVLEQLKQHTPARNDITPEVISAAYARISRDPRPIDEIRNDARQEVEKARKSNSTIIFKMGHHSVAEHAVFNLDVVGVSRLAMEELEKFRLCSYTEKSQRYITLASDFIVPPELKATPFEVPFRAMIKKQNEAYYVLYEKLKKYVFEKHPQLAKDPKQHNLLEGWAKEDARYITALATQSQVGLTVNARNLELMLRRFASSSLKEVNMLGGLLYEQIAEVAPSIVIFHEANDRDRNTYKEVKQMGQDLFSRTSVDAPLDSVTLIEYTQSADRIVAASLLHAVGNAPYQQCRAIADTLSEKELSGLFKASWRNMQFYDSMLREFEYVNLTFSIVLSAACFGQLKRHRMSTLTTQAYNPVLGVTIPASISDINMKDYFLDIVNETNDLYCAIKKEIPHAAEYILTNAHRRRVLMRLNARELYHISRLREDVHAQWDIQNISRAMSSEAKKVMPHTFGLIGGKDQYNEIYRTLYGAPPKVTKALLPGVRKIK